MNFVKNKQLICNRIMDRFLELDKNQRLPLDVSLHLLFCKTCRTQVRLCTLAEKAAAAPLLGAVPFTDESLIHIMKKIDPEYSTLAQAYPVSFTRWVVSGVLMIVFMLMFGVIKNDATIQNSLDLSFYIIFGCMVTAYCAFFIGSNMDFFIKKIETSNFLKN